jgi:ATP-dependent exoDNAse (exonuclease V) alpha subunit
MLRAADRPHERDWFGTEALAAALDEAPHLTAEQRDAVREAARPDGVSIVEAGAGTGKTTLARVLVDAARRSNLKVIGLAPSWVAADELAKSTQMEAVAIARWRFDHEHGRGGPLDEKSIIVVDEAGMAGTRDMSAILNAAHESGSKVVLIGDRRQLASVAGASALRGVSEVVRRGAILDGVRRQKIDWQRAASVLMARGDAEAGLRAYAARSRLELVAGEVAARDRVIALWKEQRAQYGEDVLVVTRRNADCTALNLTARQALKAEGRIQGEDFSASSIDRDNKATTISLACGDRVRFGESLPRLGIRNGNRGRVEAIERDLAGNIHIAFALEDGRRIEGAWSSFAREKPDKTIAPPRIVHAYAGTAYAAQGRTTAASVVYVATATDAREVYLGLTRHSHEARIVVERERLDALCRQRQTDYRIDPTETAMRERLFDEARHYREKTNVADFCPDRAAFLRTERVALAQPEIRKWTVARVMQAARTLREALAWIDPSTLFVPLWRIIDRRNHPQTRLPENLTSIIDRARQHAQQIKNERPQDWTHER